MSDVAVVFMVFVAGSGILVLHSYLFCSSQSALLPFYLVRSSLETCAIVLLSLQVHHPVFATLITLCFLLRTDNPMILNEASLFTYMALVTQAA